MYPAVPYGKEEFLMQATDMLASSPIAYYQQMKSIRATWKSSPPHLAAGVLLLLSYKKKSLPPGTEDGEFVFVLIKRSPQVSQPGDLSCPGGILHRTIDPLLRPLVSTGLVPVMRGRALDYALQKDRDTFRLMTLFLTNAVREAWEEIRLSPFNIRFLGALPSYELIHYRRTVFPLVAFIPKEQVFRPNNEVERIVEIPLNAFLDKNSYGRFTAVTSNRVPFENEEPSDSPCLVYRDEQGREEILWGATFSVIMSFLEIVIGFRPPEPLPERIVTKVLPPKYTCGRCNRL